MHEILAFAELATELDLLMLFSAITHHRKSTLRLVLHQSATLDQTRKLAFACAVSRVRGFQLVLQSCIINSSALGAFEMLLRGTVGLRDSARRLVQNE